MLSYLTEKSWIEFDDLPKNLIFSLFHFEVLWAMRPEKTEKKKFIWYIM